MATFKFPQRISHDNFKVIGDQIRAGTMHVLRDPAPGGIKMNYVVGKVTSAFNLSKKVEVNGEFYYNPKDDIKFTKIDDVWYLVITTAKRQQ